MALTKRHLVYGALFVMMAISYLDRVNLSVAASAVAREFGLGPVAMGYVFSSYLWTYLVFLVPMGLAVDRWGSRALGAASLLVWSVGGALTGAVAGLTTLLGARMLLGLGESAAYPVGGRVVREWAPPAERGQAAAWLNGGAYAGLAVGAIAVGWLVADFGWRASFVVTGVVGALAGVAWFALYRVPSRARWLSRAEHDVIRGNADEVVDDPDVGVATAAPDGAPSRVSARESLGLLLRSPTMWGLALTQGCAGYTLYLFLTWLPTYLADTRGLSVVTSGLFTAIPYAVAAVLGLVIGRVTDAYLRRSGVGLDARRRVIAGCALLSSVILLTPVITATWLLLALFSVSLTCVSAAMGMCIALTNDLLRDGRHAGTAVSFLIFGGNAFGLVAPIATGYLVAGTGAYGAAFVLAGVLLVIGCGAVLGLTRRPIDPASPVSRPLTPA